MTKKNEINYKKCSTELTALLDHIKNNRKRSGCSVFSYWKYQALAVSITHNGSLYTWNRIRRTIGDMGPLRNLYQFLHHSTDPIPRDIVLTNVFVITTLSHEELVQTIELPNIEEEEIMNRLVRSGAKRAIGKVRNQLSIIAANGITPL